MPEGAGYRKKKEIVGALQYKVTLLLLENRHIFMQQNFDLIVNNYLTMSLCYLYTTSPRLRQM